MIGGQGDRRCGRQGERRNGPVTEWAIDEVGNGSRCHPGLCGLE